MSEKGEHQADADVMVGQVEAELGAEAEIAKLRESVGEEREKAESGGVTFVRSDLTVSGQAR